MEATEMSFSARWQVLSDVIEHFREQGLGMKRCCEAFVEGIQVVFASLGMRLQRALERFGLLETLGEAGSLSLKDLLS